MTDLNLTGYHLSFDDEFNSFSPNNVTGGTGPWEETIFNGANTYGAQNYSSADGGLNAYLKAGGKNPFSVGNGVLTVQATPNTPGSTGDYTSGLIDNRDAFNQVQGYFEMRAQLPAGAGLWPGFWMMPTVDVNGGTPEIDAMEAFGATYQGQGGANQVHYDLHSRFDTQDNGSWATVPGASLYTGYHTYGVDWEPTLLTFYVDGQSVGTMAPTADLTGGMYMLASLLTGDPTDWPGPLAGETGALKIDYVRAYSKDPATPAVALQTVSSPDGGGMNLYGATTLNGVPTPPSPPAPVSHTIVLHMAETAYQGDAKFTVSVNGAQVGGVRTVGASQGGKLSQNVELSGTWPINPATVGITFLNDAYGGTATTDRNVFVNGISVDHVEYADTSAALMSNGTRTFSVGPGAATTTAPTSVLTISLSEDAWQGNAQFTLAVDGKPVAGPQSVTSLHSTGSVQDFTFVGNLAKGSHVLAVSYVNDASGRGAGANRNLYVAGASYNDVPIVGSTASLLNNGTMSVGFAV